MYSAAAEAAAQIQAYGFIREMIYSHIIMQYKQYHRRTANALHKYTHGGYHGHASYVVVGDSR